MYFGYIRCNALLFHQCRQSPLNPCLKKRLLRGRRSKVTSSSAARLSGEESGIAIENIRNVGIMAHIDAGKTTTTERILYYSGVIRNPGEVHHGDTVTDFLPQERERGITIQSAVVSFGWEGHSMNLIDTPGHVDFTFEVQRSLRVVDSAIAILDGSAGRLILSFWKYFICDWRLIVVPKKFFSQFIKGVEAQTLTVWRQAADYNLPRLIYLNKMDKVTIWYQ